MTNDTHVEELLVAHARGELEGGERARVEGHLRDCAACRESLAAFSGLIEELGAGVVPAPPIHWGAYRAELRGKLERRAAPRSTAWGAVWRPAPALVAVGLLAALVYVGLPGGGRGPLTGERIPLENLILASRLDMLAKLDVVQQLDVIEDFDVINQLDRLSAGEG
jgi:anti-sigma factor RsiW